MKFLTSLVIAGLVAFTIPTAVDAANVNARNNKYSAYEGTKLADGVTMYANDQKALFIDDGKIDIKTVLMRNGAESATIYTVMIKNENEMNYAVFGDVTMSAYTNFSAPATTAGKQPSVSTFGALGSAVQTASSGNSVDAMVKAINNGNVAALGQYRVVTPLEKQGNVYIGTLQYTDTVNNNSYNEIFHVAVSESKYSGPNVKFIAIDEASDSKVYPKISHILTQKNK